MFTFRCPICGKQHDLNNAFETEFATRCLRCAAAFRVTEEVVHGSNVVVGVPSGDGIEEAVTARVPDGVNLPLDDEIQQNLPSEVDGSFDDPEDRVPLTESNLEDLLDEGVNEEAGSRTQRRRRNALRAHHARRRVGQYANAESAEAGAYPEDDDRVSVSEELVEEIPDGESKNRPWLLIGAISAVVVVFLGLGSYFAFFRGPAKKTSDKVAKADKGKTGVNVTPAPEKTETKKEDPKPSDSKPAVPAKDPEAISLAAARLAAEIASNPEETYRKYENALLEVTGLYERIDTKEVDQPSARPHAVLSGAPQPVYCDLQGSPTAMARWNTLPAGQPITVRGVYGKNGCLHACELRTLRAPADAKYKDKDVEITGFVDSVQAISEVLGYPTIVFETETTSRARIHCLFRKTDEVEVKGIQPGTVVTIRGTCSGRQQAETQPWIRIDNCRMIYSSAPTPPTPRVEALSFLREYEEDLLAKLLAPIGLEDKVDEPVSVTQLAKEIAANSRIVDEKYKYKMVTVTGKLQTRSAQVIRFETDDTNLVFRVQCYFTKQAYQDVPIKNEYSIRGLCTGMLDGRTLRLDNCEYPDAQRSKDRRRLTAEFLPHSPDRMLTYDIVVYPAGGAASTTIVRQAYYQREDGVTDVVSTHSAKYAGKGLFEPGDDSKWVGNKKTQKFRLPGSVIKQRFYAGFVEVGENTPTKNGETAFIWKPALKLSARLGDTWKWSHANSNHIYTVDKFDTDAKDRASVVITETVFNDNDRDHPIEIRHVYVRNVGETERSETQRIAAKEKRTLAEKKLIEDADDSHIKD